MSDQLNGQPLGHNPNATWDEMIAFRETFNLKEHLKGNPPAAPVEQAHIQLSVAQLKMLCARAGLDVIEQNAASQAGGRLLNLEEKLEALKIDRDGLAARVASSAVQLERAEKLIANLAARNHELAAEIVTLKAEVAAMQTLNTEAPPAQQQETQDGTI